MKNILSEETCQRLAEVFKVLADPTRIKIINALKEEELCVCHLAKEIQMEQSAVSHQLRLLRNMRLVKNRRVGKEVYYSLDDEHVLRLFDQGLEHVQHI